MIKLCTLGVICMLALSCAGGRNGDSSIGRSSGVSPVEEQEYVVYASVLDQLFPAGMGIHSGSIEKIQYFESATEFVIYENTDMSPRTAPTDLFNFRDVNGRMLDSALITDLIERNQGSTRLRERIPTTRHYELIPQPYLDRNELSQRFPATPGVIHFSRVGFSRTHMQAIVAVAQYHDLLQGAGQLCLLERKGTAWLLSARILPWSNEI